ncbi:MAG: sigma-70 family RNA polymerase sigma factor [Verrucomicrobiota bacterium]|nr:sigma-70 family RNA polymerase sigma factor [Verrucomicrobiota bacterium]
MTNRKPQIFCRISAGGGDMLMNMTASDLDLLARFARENAQDAFGEIVRRHLNLVYSAALRQVRSPPLAEEIAQSVFTDLARHAGRLKSDTILTAWLYAVTRRTAIDAIRKESRRRLREQIAVEMSSMNATANDWTQIEPLLDDALAALDETDRAAILLRYFENKSLREVGEAPGASEDAAQKRVSRALERLREFFSKRNITIGAGGLAVLISANAVQSAPAGLATAISTAAALAGTTISTSTAIAATKTIAMTELQKAIIGAALVAAVGTGAYEAHQAAQLREKNQTLQQQQAPPADRIWQLQRERNDATNRLAELETENTQLQADQNEAALLKLRGEVSQLEESAAEREKALDDSELAETVARINQVKEWLKQSPTENIPELMLLSARDWINYADTPALWHGTTNDFEWVLGNLRTDAKKEFAAFLGSALDDYLLANGGQLPNDLSELEPYVANAEKEFHTPGEMQAPELTAAMLQRYQLLHTGNVSDLTQSEPLIAEKSPIQNVLYDALFRIGAFSYSCTGVSLDHLTNSGPVPFLHAGELEKLFKKQ